MSAGKESEWQTEQRIQWTRKLAPGTGEIFNAVLTEFCFESVLDEDDKNKRLID